MSPDSHQREEAFSVTTPPFAPARHANRARIALFGAAVVTIVLYFVPFGKYVLYPLMLFSTFVHEMGHGLTAVALGGDFLYFKMWADGSGVAAYAGHFSAFGKATTAAGGLLGPPLGAAVLFALGRRANWAKTVLYAISIICALCILLVVRNLFGIGFVALLGLACFAVAHRTQPGTAQMVAVFLAIQLCTSVFSRIDYLFMQHAHTGGGALPSDSEQIAMALIGPYWLWGGLIAVISVAILVWGITTFLKALRPITSIG